MDTSTERMHTAQLDVSDTAASMTAPMVMWGALLRLAGDTPVIASAAAAETKPGSTSWRVVWMTDSRVIFCEALKEVSNWTAYSDRDDADRPDSMTTWSRPRSEIICVDLTGVEIWRPYQEADRQWRQGAQITFRDGTRLVLPLFENRLKDQADRERVDALIETAAAFG
jgi:hypothetical protein